MKAHTIQQQLIATRKNPNDIMLCNWFHKNWEMDVARFTPAGMLYEYEVKISRADFRCDFRKKKVKYNYSTKEETVIRKHDLMASGDYIANRFFFVCREGMVDVRDIPPHAGLIFVYPDREPVVVKSSKLLHNRKYWDTNDMYQLARSLSWRENYLREKLERMKLKIKELESRHI